MIWLMWIQPTKEKIDLDYITAHCRKWLSYDSYEQMETRLYGCKWYYKRWWLFLPPASDNSGSFTFAKFIILKSENLDVSKMKVDFVLLKTKIFIEFFSFLTQLTIVFTGLYVCVVHTSHAVLQRKPTQSYKMVIAHALG